MLLKAFNRSLLEDRETTTLSAAAAATATTLTVSSTDLAAAGTSSTTWANNDYMVINPFGENAEVMQMAAAVTSATSLTIDREGQSGGLRYAHSVGEPVYRIDYNQVEFYRNSTNTTSGASTLTTISLQMDDEFTRYEDTSNTTGYGFVRFKNETTGSFSSYSDGVNYEAGQESSSYDPRTLFRLRKRVRVLLNEDRPDSKLSNDMIDDAVNDKQRDIAHMRLWSFFEVERSLSAVANQHSYDIPSTVQKVYNINFRTQPLLPINYDKWKNFWWNNTASASLPSHVSIWNRQMLLYPRPSTAARTTTLGAAITTTTATSITVAATSTFKKGDYYRFIIDSEVIYATAATTTTFTGCLRGQESTTAAIHSNGATVTERDIVYTGHVEPTDLRDTQDRTPVPEPDVLAYGAAIDLAPGLEKDDLVDRFERKYTVKVKELEGKFAMKFTSRFGRIKGADEVLIDDPTLTNPNLYPSNLG